MASLARSVSVALLFCSAAAAAGCSGASSLPDAYVSEAEPLRRATPATPSYSFFLVSRANGAYQASELTAPVTTCLDGTVRMACPFGEIDLGLLGLAPADADAIVAGVTADPSQSTLVFVGSFERRATLRASSIALQVQEVWRAPAVGSVRAYDAWYHVSHDAKQALLVSRWQSRNLASIDLSAAPWTSDCDPDADGKIVCVPSKDGILDDAATPAGILVDGWLGQGGTLHVRQYFAKISVGSQHAPNGYWYCRADQFACDLGACAPSADVCTHEGFHGGGLKTIYTRTPQSDAQPWLVSTTQLTPAESAALQAPPSSP
jgi:hypothetical protein